MFFRNLFWRKTENITVDYQKLHLVRPNPQYLRSFRNSYREYTAHNVEDFGYYSVGTNRAFKRFLIMSDELARGVNLDIYETVQTSLFWLTDGTFYLGSGSLRHTLTDHLKKIGGNIGYCVRPAVWRMGLGTVQLRLLCVEAKKIGLKTARITCFEENTASRRVIEKNGGRWVERVINDIGGKDKPTLIYEIDLTRV